MIRITGYLLILLMVAACENHSHYLGYIEGRLTYIAAPVSGKLVALAVVRGQQLKAGQPLFQLEQQPESDDLNAALATVKEAQANVADKIVGDRPSELAAMTAQIAQAQAQVDYAQKDVSRKQQLVKANAVEQNQLDLANQNLQVAEGSLKLYQANLVTGKLGGREDQIKSLQAALDNARANLQKAQWVLRQKTVTMPVDAQVFDTYYRVGEQVPANQAVLSILAPRDIKVVFFADEPALGHIKVGQRVRLSCDGCRARVTAIIRFISPSAEYTPPIIYSRTARSKLVYQVEAEFERQKGPHSQAGLNPGEPVEVTL